MFASLAALGSSWPLFRGGRISLAFSCYALLSRSAHPPPIPLLALKMPGVQKQISEMITTCESGEANFCANAPRSGSGGRSSTRSGVESSSCDMVQRGRALVYGVMI